MSIVNPSRATGELFGPVGPRVNFGWVTDCHLDNLKDPDTSQGGKIYKDTEHKLQDIAAIFNARNDLSFVFQNGDFIDGAASASAAQADIATAIAALNVNVPLYHNIGNHEMLRLTKAQVVAGLGTPAQWYSFVKGNVTFIVLDGNFTADDDSANLEVSAGVPGVSPYISYIPPTQRQWLADTISASPHPCVILCHYPVYYEGAFSWGLTNAEAVRDILEAAGGKVIGCCCGHLHDAFVKRVNGILYITTHATVTGSYPQLNYSIISVFPGTAKTIKVLSHGYNMSHIEAT